ncbi:O-Glycosyl hydrolase [Pustulibacterium marinum]|uniref:O-Glycosyl hydrolase n=1 Tax=Pustulibacterium marinum TaxID=1224947 RepID=A0A1I7H618_9FLAO|nr:glycoside hydrolase [Pustulibacterium marinum]SFU56150.1 O-Glycosyl hydrolase [Pustulibacterium marinum]
MKNNKLHVFLLFLLILANATAQEVTSIKINTSEKYQTIDNFGAAGCWYSEGIGKYWPQEKRERIAELLFSKAFDVSGNPVGIGLSAWRFNIGAGTFEQGDASGIWDVNRRVESFLAPDGSYDWTKQEGYQWFLKQANSYGVERLIAFSNSAPVQFNKNGYGFKTEKDYVANLKDEHYEDFAEFLATVVAHFNGEGIHFDYISPINEPQWDWFGEPGHAKQEGSPWSNENISKVAHLLDAKLTERKQDTKIMLSEAAQLDFLYSGNRDSRQQIQDLYSKESAINVLNLAHVPDLVVGHSYFTESSDEQLIEVRQAVKKAGEAHDITFWQSEYSMLGDGYKDGKKGRISAIDCALFLAKVIHFDLTEANAGAWQFWNALEPGNPDFDTRYYLIALQPNETHTNGDFSVTKNLWAMGHFSRFIRPGMQRIALETGLDANASAQELMASAYLNPETNEMVVVAINYSETAQTLKLDFQAEKYHLYDAYRTSAEENMNLSKIKNNEKIRKKVTLPKRSITTFVFKK